MRSDVAEIRRAAERAVGLTRQILAFTRQEVANTRLVDVGAVVTDVSRMLGRLIGEDIKLTVKCDQISWRACADVSQIEQVLINLVVNARDAMPEGGRISIATRRFCADSSLVAAHPGVTPGRYIALEVTDDGAGMTDEVLAHLFEPFFTTKEPGRGTGLGLSIVSSIVGQSYGHILVESSPGLGSRFTVLFPVAGEATDARLTRTSDRRRFDGRATILLVEDEEQVRSIAAQWLTRYGYDVHEAGDGEEAFALVSEGLTPDLLITDIVMPRMGGVALADSLRSAFASLKVLYLSGYSDRPEVQGRLSAEGVSFLQKPFSPGRLLSEVRTLLNWSAADRRSTDGLASLPSAAARRATTSIAPLGAGLKTV
jgi:CheY-like chemotaxis protein